MATSLLTTGQLTDLRHRFAAAPGSSMTFDAFLDAGLACLRQSLLGGKQRHPAPSGAALPALSDALIESVSLFRSLFLRADVDSVGRISCESPSLASLNGSLAHEGRGQPAASPHTRIS